ncbi:DUF305 domain-containing protein [bacterium]|nr:DUF305 domain-containing protein [bacterium]
METKTFVTTLLSLIIGLGIGYGAGSHAAPPTNMHMMPDGSMMQNQAEMQSDTMKSSMQGVMMGMKGKTGAELEKAFLEEMIVHHQGAVDMAKELLAGTKRPELVKFGNEIITVQSGEIAQMKSWLKEWFTK